MARPYGLVFPVLLACSPAVGPVSDPPPEADADGDGYAAEASGGSDCDDADPEVHPGADDDPSDGIDQDCGYDEDTAPPDSAPVVDALTDSDGDGFATQDEGGLDCDDGDPDVYPGSADGRCLDCDGDGVIWVPDSVASLAEAVAAAPSGGLVCVRAGTYTGTLALEDSRVAIVGVDGPDATILDARGRGSPLLVSGGELALVGLTLTGGVAENGGGLGAYSAAVSLAEVRITDNQATTSGGGIYIEVAPIWVRDAQIWGNSALDTSGGGLRCSRCTGVLVRVDVRSNYARGGEGRTQGGGGIYAFESPRFELHNVILAANITEGRGGGLDADTVEGLVLDHVTLVANQGGNGGGAFLQELPDPATIQSSVVSYNVADDDADGIWLFYSDAVFTWSDLWAEEGGDVTDGAPQDDAGNLSADPGFVFLQEGFDPTTWDLRPADGSPLQDAADPSELDPDGSPSDIGATGGPGAG